eukprot:TRINITY_DN39015_c0_g1_i1.p2 TRINITY_DN39015_c0_g1~~TRINITY_DN39015_c0_g1_i1.p2  ORF type:complete len:179 (+),score=14.13 TRINITY_DN39015_c0_g1_i1:61-597(+)
MKTRGDVLWRCAQVALGSGALFALYDWETKMIAERERIREDEAHLLLAAQSSEEARQRAAFASELEKARAKYDAEVEIAALAAKQAADALAKSKVQREVLCLAHRTPTDNCVASLPRRSRHPGGEPSPGADRDHPQAPLHTVWHDRCVHLHAVHRGVLQEGRMKSAIRSYMIYTSCHW